MLKYFYIAFVIILIWIVLLVNKILPVPLFHTHEKLVKPSWETPKPFKNADTLSYAYLYLIMQKHYSKPAYQNILGGLYFRDDLTPENYFIDLVPNSYPNYKNAGRFGHALIYKEKKDYKLMLEELQEITVTDKPYYFCELGWAQAYQGDLANSIVSFEKELSYKNGNRSSAYKGLAEVFFATGNFEGIHKLMSEPLFVKNCPDYILRNEYFSNGPVLTYITYVLKLNVTWDLLVAAALIALLWGYYYTRFKLFAKRDYILYFIVFGLSCIVTPFCVILYDILHYGFQISDDGGFWANVLYYIFGVGLIEETTKALPVLICVLVFSKRIKEPVDYLVLATISALGFAGMENIMYFDRYYGNQSYSIIHDRGVLSVVMHIFCSTVIWYGYIQTKLLKNLKHIFIGIAVSITAHGMYDVFFSQSVSSMFYIFSFGMVIVSFFALKMFYNSALNQSPFFDARVNYASGANAFILVAGLGIILVFEFVLEAIRFGSPHANDSLLSSLLAYTAIVVLYSSNFARIVLCNKHWVRMRDMLVSNFYSQRNVGNETVLLASNKSTHKDIYPLYGKIVRLESYDGTAENYAIKLDTPISYNNAPIYEVLACFAAKTSEAHRIHVKLLYGTNTFDLREDGKVNDQSNMIRLDYSLMETAAEKESIFKSLNSNWKWATALIVAFFLFIFTFKTFMDYTTSIDYYRGAERSLENLDIYTSSVHCKSAVYFNEDNYEARILFAKIRMDGGFYPQALVYLNQVNDVPRYIAPDYYAIKGLCEYKIGMTNKSNPLLLQSIVSFKECEKHPVKFDSLYWYQSSAYENTGNGTEAIESMNLFLSDKSHISKYAYLKMADLYFSQKLYSEAYTYYTKLIESKDFYAQALLKRGLCNHYLNKPNDACTDIETAHSYGDPKAIDYLNQWCRVGAAEDSTQSAVE
ncbi:PrsW family glutamic-type intramembrane protease [Cytophaga aurantiaca]|uniref:PrsW family glutamic-type intramembrane protease n=1 Tax=Cytophaga aurantiaca TaxID=29530 RepID=UPI000369EB2A|nr:PrsW family glutamic-type intramembrane protease [Cytophaga aurantiaca]